MKEAKYYIVVDQQKKKVQCRLCPAGCILLHGEFGKCKIRQNIDGKLYTLTYGIVSSIALDPIEKKPLYHFYPGKLILSIGSWGCNFKCGFCQNWSISQVGVEKSYSQTVTPQILLSYALKEKENIGIAYTYNEPLINIEFIAETAEVFHSKGLKNVLVTNGYILEQPLRDILPYIDAANIDLKSFNEEFYEKVCGGKLKFVLNTIEIMVKNNKHVELTTLVIPGYNDSEKEILDIVNYVASLSKEIPLHFSRYYPNYEFEVQPTPIKTLVKCYDLAKEKLDYVYLGNILDEKYSSTNCPSCGEKLILRIGYDVNIIGLKNDRCKFCSRKINIVI